jgi:hypothetical protein
MVCISKYVLKIATEQFENVPESTEELAQFVTQVDKYSDDVCTILAKDTVLATFDILLQQLVK